MPWHADLHERLIRLRKSNRMPHALLFSGPPHTGKRSFALAAASWLLCQEPADGRQCGECDNCLLLKAGTHPDIRRIYPEERKAGKSTGVMNERKLIVIDQIRDMIEWSGQNAQRGGMKVVIVHPAEQMNINSANALLKCLEEPAADTVIILVSDQPGRLLPTIRSRCQHFDFRVPGAEESLRWLLTECPEKGEDELRLLLSISAGAPLAVLEEFDEDYLKRRSEVASAIEQLVRGSNPLDAAKPLARGDAVVDLGILESIFADAARKSVGGDEKVIKNKDMESLLARLEQAMSPPELLGCIELIAEGRRSAASPSNPNISLLTEALFVDISARCRL